MPKVKPTWVCQHCERQFTTKYSLMRHFKRFPEHSPPNLSPGDGDIKPITVKVNEHVRTVTAIPIGMAMPTSASTIKTTKASSSHEHGTRYQHHQQEPADSEMADRSATKRAQTSMHPGAPFSLHNVSDIEESPSHTESESPANDIYGSKEKEHFPFLPPFLEHEQILDIATPQQQLTNSPPPPAISSSDPSRLLSSPLSAHYNWVFAKDTANAEQGQALLSPLAPACTNTNFRQVFQEEEEKLQRLTTSSHHHKLRSPVELAALDQSLLLGDEEATSPFTFLEKTSSHEPMLPIATSLDFLSPPVHPNNEGPSLPANEISMDDLDLGRFYAPMV